MANQGWIDMSRPKM
jgi:hypothetical protein